MDFTFHMPITIMEKMLEKDVLKINQRGLDNE